MKPTRHYNFVAGDKIALPSLNNVSAGTVMVLCRIDAAQMTNGGRLVEISSTTEGTLYPWTTGDLYVSILRSGAARVGPFAPSGSITMTDWHWLVVRDDTTWECLQADLDGNLYSLATTPGVGYSGFTNRVAGFYDTRSLQGDIARLLVFSNELNDAQIQAIIAGGIGPRATCLLRMEGDKRLAGDTYVLNYGGDESPATPSREGGGFDPSAFYVDLEPTDSAIEPSWLVHAPLKIAAVDERITNSVDDSEATMRGLPVVGQFADGSNGVKINADNASARICFPIPEQTTQLKAGIMCGRIKATQLFSTADSPTTHYLFALHDAYEGIEGAANSDYLEFALQFEGGITGPEIQVANATAGVINRVSVPDYVLLENEEIHIACTWETAPDDDTRVAYKVWLNGYCVTDNALTPFSQHIESAKYFVVGNGNTAGSRPADCILQDVALATNYRASMADIRAMAKGTFDWTGLPAPQVLYRPAFTWTVLPYTVIHYDKDEGVLWGRDKANPSHLYSTTDLSGETGWTQRHTFASSVQDICTTDDYVFVSIAGGLFRSSKTSISFTEVLDTTNGGIESVAVMGWGLDGQGKKVCLAEYYTPWFASGSKLHASDDQGDTWRTVATLTNDSGVANSHWHAAAYDPFTGYLWANWGDEDNGIIYSPDNGQTVNYLLPNSNLQTIGIAFNKDWVLQCIDVLGQNQASACVAISKSGKKLHNYAGAQGTYSPPHPSGTRGNFDRRAMLAGRSIGGRAYVPGWSAVALDDGRFVVWCNNATISPDNQHSYVMLLSADLEQQVILKNLPLGYASEGISVAVAVGKLVFFGPNRLDLDPALLTRSDNVALKADTTTLKADTTTLKADTTTLKTDATAIKKLNEADQLLEDVGGVRKLKIYERGTSTELVPAKTAKQTDGTDLTDPATQRLGGYQE